jgi:hypothetical protein
MIINKAILHVLTMPTCESAIADVEAYLEEVGGDPSPPAYLNETRLLLGALKTVLAEKQGLNPTRQGLLLPKVETAR